MDEDSDAANASTSLPTEGRSYTSDERMDIRIDGKQLVCIDYPGIVQNAEKALCTLGGVKAINRSIKDETKRLELRFRPGDTYCKPATGSTQQTAGLVLRVRRRKKPSSLPAAETDDGRDNDDGAGHHKRVSVTSGTLGSDGGGGGSGSGGGGGDDGYEYRVDVVGTVSSAIRFEGMCDFQYMPVQRKPDGSYRNLLGELMIKSFVPDKDYLTRDAPLFLSPVLFSRFDTPQDYGYLLKKRIMKDNSTTLQPSQILAAGRKSRQKFTMVISFTDPTPQEPTPESLVHSAKFKDTGLKEALIELFEERPIWSRTALAYRLRNCAKQVSHLKDVLPSLAYFFVGGPWRTFWVRMGYNPRTDPAAKKFQGVDFRRQRGLGEAPREYYAGKKRDIHRKRETEINLSLLRGAHSFSVNSGPSVDSVKKEPRLRDFEFHADVLPPNRQVVYMVCDIFDAEVQALVHKNDGKETECDERNGWCVPNFPGRCRAIMNRHVRKLCPFQDRFRTKGMKSKRQRGGKGKVRERGDDDDDDDDDDDEMMSQDMESVDDDFTPQSSQSSR